MQKPTPEFRASLNFLHAMSVQFLSKHHRRRDQQQALLKCRLIQAIFGINYLSGDVRRLEKRINNWNYSFVMTSRAASHTPHIASAVRIRSSLHEAPHGCSIYKTCTAKHFLSHFTLGYQIKRTCFKKRRRKLAKTRRSSKWKIIQFNSNLICKKNRNFDNEHKSYCTARLDGNLRQQVQLISHPDVGISVEGREGESSLVPCLNCDFVFHQTVNGAEKAALAKKLHANRFESGWKF